MEKENILKRAVKWYIYLWWVGWSDMGDTKKGRAILKREIFGSPPQNKFCGFRAEMS